MHRNIYEVAELRTGIEENGAYTGFVYNNGQAINEQNQYGQIQVSNILVNKLEATQQNGNTYYYIANAHGDIEALADANGLVNK